MFESPQKLGTFLQNNSFLELNEIDNVFTKSYSPNSREIELILNDSKCYQLLKVLKIIKIFFEDVHLDAKNLLNFIFLSMKFHNYHDTIHNVLF